MTTMIGDLKGGNVVEKAVQEHIEKWMATYLRAVEPLGEYAEGSLQDFRSIQTSPEFEHWPEDQIPGLLIVSPGMVQGSAKIAGDGMMRAKFICGLGVICSAGKQADANDLAKWYGIAIAALMLQNPSISGFARGCDLEDMSYDELGSDGIRTQATALVVFSIDVPDVIDTGTAPWEPTPDDPPEDVVTAEKAEVTTTAVEKVGEE